jgi:aminomethyltransferase
MTKDFRPATTFFYPRTRLSPYFEGTQASGAKAYSVYNHMYLPSWYRDTEEEYWAVTNDVVIWDVAVERQVQIKGPDAFEFTNFITTKDLHKCKVKQCKYTLICDDKGGVINDPVLSRLDNDIFWLSLSDSDVLLWAKGLAYNSKWNVELSEPDVAPMQVQGPKSKSLMISLFGSELESLRYYHCLDGTLSGMEMLVTRTGYTGEIGYEIYLKNASKDGLKLWNTMLEAGKPYNISPTGPSLIRRLEHGIRNYGQDVRLDNNPYEVGLGFAVDLNQEADFVGKESLTQIKKEGLKKKLVGIEFGTERMKGWNEDYWPVIENDKQIGQVTTAAYSPSLKKNIGYAMLPIERTEIGTKITILARGDETGATVIKEPFVRGREKQ